MKKLFIFLSSFLLLAGMSHVFAGNDPGDKTTCLDVCPPPAYSYTFTVNISQANDCLALAECNLEVVLYRWTGSGNPQAIDRKPFVYGTYSYVFSESIDPSVYPYVIAKIVDQPGTPCGYPYNQSWYVIKYIGGTTGGSYTVGELTPCN
jgi:hypothetical protein